MFEFTLQEVLFDSISKVMMIRNIKCIRILNELADEIMSETLYGDSLRLQQVLADFLLVSVHFVPNGGQLGISGSLTKDYLGVSIQLVHLELR